MCLCMCKKCLECIVCVDVCGVIFRNVLCLFIVIVACGMCGICVLFVCNFCVLCVVCIAWMCYFCVVYMVYIWCLCDICVCCMMVHIGRSFCVFVLYHFGTYADDECMVFW